MGRRKTRKSREDVKKGEKQKKRMGVKIKRLCYPKENVALALQDIGTGKTIAECSRLYNIPESTIRAKKLGIYADKKPGPSSVLSEEEEKQLVDWIFECCKKGFPVTKPQLIESVKIICENLKKKNPFRDNKPGRSWYEAFLKRNPEISERISENVSLNRAKVSEQSLRSWFEEVSEYLIDQDLITVEPNKIFNCDETGIPLNPKPPSVLAPKGYKTVYSVVGNNEKENVTVLITANATGDIAPTFILFTGKSLPDNASAMAPKDFAFGCSENGWMTAKIFFEYIANVFEPWLTKMKIKRPVLMYMDGHSSHMTLHLSKFCSDNGIVLVALHANATHILQPLDVAFFRTLKIQWQKIYKTFCENSSSIGIHKYQFAPVLKKTLDSMDTVKILENGFKKCGLYPFDIDAIDLNKILCRKQNQSIDSVTESDSDMVQNDVDKLKVLESLLSADKLESFKMNAGIVWRGVEKDKSLFELWYQLSHPSDTPSVTDQNTTDVINDPEVTSETRDDSAINEDYIVMELQLDSNGSILNEEIFNDTLPCVQVIDSNQVDLELIKEYKVLSVPTTEHHTTISAEESCDQLNSKIDITNDSFKGHEMHKENVPTVKYNNNAGEVLDVSVKGLKTENQSYEEYSDRAPFKDTTNLQTQESFKSVKQFLPWPIDVSSKQSTKRRKSALKTPPVVSGTAWQEIVQAKENEKRAKAEEVIRKKKIKVEKQEELRIRKEAV